ncbi:MAG TPA: YceI family protein [Candidatus Dormibacteraeota bacterium]|jgi:polyisoprenoid-binding protein YceI|nr:YceI family protein [Candidatus Dormibacteraeota bacterium]
MTTAYTPTGLSGLSAGTWTIDPVHSEVAFSVRHMMVGKVRGRFTAFSGEIVATDDGSATVNVSIDVTSVDTQNAQRDEHIRSGDFFEAATYPQAAFRSTGLRAHGGQSYVDGELTLHGVTRPVTLELEPGGVTRDPYGNVRAGFSATTEIARNDYGITIQMPMDGGGVVVGEKVRITLEVEAVLQAA